MSDFGVRFEEHSKAAVQALNAKASEFRSSFYEFEPAYVRRLLERIAASLKKIDSGGTNHPIFLAGRGQLLPQKAINLVSTVPSAINDSGMTHFISNVLPELIEVDEGLAKAIGINEIRSAEIKSSQLRSIERYVDWSKNAYSQISTSRGNVTTQAKEVSDAKSEVTKFADEAKVDLKKIKDIRAAATRLSSGTKTSPALSAILRDAQSKLQEIEINRTQAQSTLTDVASLQDSIVNSEVSASEAIERLEKHDIRANDILNNATQAGLAGAYKLERDKLAKQQLSFAITFYGIIAAIIVYAAVFIVPIASEIILNHQNARVTVGESGLLLFVRVLIILPAFWALLFTNKRYIYLETLQMDYAAKAVTALAYSGYRDELDDDTRLSTRLRDGLVTRFVEHPSRLLGKKVETNLSITSEDGSKVIAESHSPGSPSLLSKNDLAAPSIDADPTGDT